MTPFLGQVQNLTQTSDPAEEPVTLAVAKAHCKVDIPDDDAYIGMLIAVARERCEAEIHRAFVSRTYLLSLDGFPFAGAPTVSQAINSERLPNICFGKIRIPKPPLLSIDSITYVDNDGITQPLGPSLYLVQSGGKLQGVVTPAYGLAWPVARYQLGSVSVAYTAGYGPASSVPASIGLAMLLCIGHWYRNREAVSAVAMAEIPMGAKYLLSAFDWGSYG